LASLDLSGNQVGDAGVRALALSANAAGLRKLRLMTCGVTDTGAVALASPHLAGLQELDLNNSSVTDDGARALAESPHLAGLKSLGLRYSQVGTAGCSALRAGFGEAVSL